MMWNERGRTGSSVTCILLIKLVLLVFSCSRDMIMPLMQVNKRSTPSNMYIFNNSVCKNLKQH